MKNPPMPSRDRALFVSILDADDKDMEEDINYLKAAIDTAFPAPKHLPSAEPSKSKPTKRENLKSRFCAHKDCSQSIHALTSYTHMDVKILDQQHSEHWAKEHADYPFENSISRTVINKMFPSTPKNPKAKKQRLVEMPLRVLDTSNTEDEDDVDDEEFAEANGDYDENENDLDGVRLYKRAERQRIRALREHAFSITNAKIDTHNENQKTRPLATLKTYESFQSRFMDFCIAEYKHDNVSADSALLFLQKTKNLGKSKGKDQQKETGDDDLVDEKLAKRNNEYSARTFYTIVSALVDLFNIQQERRKIDAGSPEKDSTILHKDPLTSNPFEFPRNYSVKLFLKNASHGESSRRLLMNDDRGSNTISDHVPMSMIPKIQLHFYKTDNISAAADNAARIQFGSRSAQTRSACFAEVSTNMMVDEGPEPIHRLSVSFDKSKTNTTGKMQSSSLFRHKNPLLCGYGNIAASFAWRFDVRKETIPDFIDPERSWFKVPLFVNKNNSELTSDTQYSFLKSAFSLLNIISSKMLHYTRIVFTIACHEAEVLPDQINHHGLLFSTYST